MVATTVAIIVKDGYAAAILVPVAHGGGGGAATATAPNCGSDYDDGGD